MKIHYHGDGSEAEAAQLRGLAGKGGQAAFLDIHYHGKEGMAGGVMRESAEEAEGGLISRNALSGGGGQAAFLDIHYHGKEGLAAASNPALSKGGQAAFLDIHYHGKEGLAAASNPALSKGGQAAFLDIHYHGKEGMAGSVMRESAEEAEGALMSRSSMAAVEAPTLEAPKLGKGGGQAAFLDIHYHGKSITDMDVMDKPGLHIGDAALLDIHYHG